MKVWRLAGKLAWHVLRGRGGDEVYLHHAESFGLFAIRLPCHGKTWALADMSWTDDDEHFVVLEGHPATESTVEAS